MPALFTDITNRTVTALHKWHTWWKTSCIFFHCKYIYIYWIARSCHDITRNRQPAKSINLFQQRCIISSMLVTMTNDIRCNNYTKPQNRKIALGNNSYRNSIAVGFNFTDADSMAFTNPGVSLSMTALVASGVISAGAQPVPPVVIIRLRFKLSAQSRNVFYKNTSCYVNIMALAALFKQENWGSIRQATSWQVSNVASEFLTPNLDLHMILIVFLRLKAIYCIRL